MQEETYKQTDIETPVTITATIIANPTGGSYTDHQAEIEESIAFLEQQGWSVDLQLTQQAGDGHRLAREAVEQKKNVVITVGGDGTINEVIQELAGSETALGALPGGTVNVWAREVGIPFDYKQASAILANGKVQRIDLGRLNDRYFLLMASIGFDAEVTQAVEKGPIKRFGVLGYLVIGSWLGLNYPNFQVIMQTNKGAKRSRALQIVFGNTQLYAGAVKLTWRAKCDDGLLDICVVRPQSFFERLAAVRDLVFLRQRRQKWVRYETTTEVKIHTNVSTAIQVDGDPAGSTTRKGSPPTIFSIAPGALKVIVPQEVSGELFTKPAEALRTNS